MSVQYFNLRAAARKIGISPQTLYDTYLPNYRPYRHGGWPMLSEAQVKAIKAEVKQRKNGKSRARRATTT